MPETSGHVSHGREGGRRRGGEPRIQQRHAVALPNGPAARRSQHLRRS
jgi:hypothetical protein